MNHFHVYLVFPISPDDQINSQEEGRTLLRKIQMIIDRSDTENGTLLYYDSQNLTAFFSALQPLEEDDLLGSFGCYTAEETISILLQQSSVIEWTEDPIHEVNEESIYYKKWDNLSRNQIDSILPVHKEISERILRISDHDLEKCLLLEVCPTDEELISIIRGSFDSLPNFTHINIVSDFLSLENWFEQNRIPRVFNLTDNRHIESHPNYISPKSPLLKGQAGRANAQNLLQSALGDKREKKYLVNIDQNNYNVYIRYEDENAMNQFHGYHLVKPITHDRDLEAEKKIPNRIKLLLEYRLEITNV
jgi:hypothetical protein